jgi:protein-L-isoaspartate(D-aspartate) O-methyltransferase
VKQLVAQDGGYRMSMFMPAVRYGSNTEQNPIRFKNLLREAEKRLERLGYGVVRTRTGDGYFGWPEHAPFDGIIVTCAAGQIPPPLVKQLAPGGRMVIPVGPLFATQSLMLVEKAADGKVRSRSLMGVRFVPLLRQDPTSR